MSYKNPDYAVAIADEQNDQDEDLFYDLKIQEKVGAALDLEYVQVNRMQREHDARNAHELEIGYCGRPFLGQKHIEQRPGQYGQEDHGRGNKERGHLYYPAEACLEAVVVILQGGKRRVCDLLDRPDKQGKHNVLELLSQEVLPGNSGGEKLGDDGDVDVQKNRIKKS